MWHLPETLREIEEAGGCESIVVELVDAFKSDTASRFDRLRESLARLDPSGVRAEAHSIRGSARQMGAEALADMCQVVETGAPKMNWPELAGQVNQAEGRFTEVCSAMAEYLRTRRLAS